MKRYDPERAPDPEQWLALDEPERSALVAAYHRRTGTRLPNWRLHALFHTIVENQLAERLPVVQETVERLMAEGPGGHDAIHALGSVLAEHIWKVMNERSLGPDAEAAYFRRLAALTARGWREGAG